MTLFALGIKPLTQGEAGQAMLTPGGTGEE